MRKNLLLLALCGIVSSSLLFLSLLTMVKADSNYVCPSCGKVLNYDDNIKWISRVTLLGNEVMDAVMYCPYCGYNTERDVMGNIKLQVHDLWEYRYGVKSALPSCGCTPLIRMNNSSTSYSIEDIKKISEDGKISLGSYPKISFSDNVTLYPPNYIR